MRLAIILAEFGKQIPDVTQYRECWPEANIRIITEADVPHIPQFDGPRYGWRMNDFYKVHAMLGSAADVAMCFDGDMRIVDREAARTLPALAQRFGICLPLNPRYTVKRDFEDGADVTGCVDQTLWHGPSVNCSPIAIDLSFKSDEADEIGSRSELSIWLAETYCAEMLKNPVRGPMAWARAMWSTGIAPLILPPQWCVCERHIAVGGEIILHEGHEAVKRHYQGVKTR